jgi:hypothetical protein
MQPVAKQRSLSLHARVIVRHRVTVSCASVARGGDDQNEVSFIDLHSGPLTPVSAPVGGPLVEPHIDSVAMEKIAEPANGRFVVR